MGLSRKGLLEVGQGRVTVYDPPRQLTLALQSAGPGPPAATTISLTLVGAGDRTIVTVVQQMHGRVQSGPDTGPAAEPSPRSPFQAPTLQSPAQNGMETTGAPFAGSPSTSPATPRGRTLTEVSLPPDAAWRKRLDGLRQAIQET